MSQPGYFAEYQASDAAALDAPRDALKRLADYYGAEFHVSTPVNVGYDPQEACLTIFQTDEAHQLYLDDPRVIEVKAQFGIVFKNWRSN